MGEEAKGWVAANLSRAGRADPPRPVPKAHAGFPKFPGTRPVSQTSCFSGTGLMDPFLQHIR